MLAMLPFLVAVGVGGTVTTSSLLAEMTDLDRLTRRANPAYTAAQASSYDRSPEPFANGDAGNFVREEGNESVMADLDGPGAVVRLWSANPQGTLRFYFDGETEPRFVVDTQALLEGKVTPYGAPFGYLAGQGANLYFPFPYAKHLKITVEGAKGLYYHVGFRTYAPGTEVETFRPDALPDVKPTAQGLEPLPTAAPKLKQTSIRPGMSAEWTAPSGEQVVTELRFRLPRENPAVRSTSDPAALPFRLRHLILEANFDGETTVRAPLGDFFAAAPGINPYRALPMEVQSDGTLICRFRMPYRTSAAFRVRNVGARPVLVACAISTLPRPWTDDSYLFHAQWSTDSGFTAAKMDMHFLGVKGEGAWVGMNMHVANPTAAWWGEGDEKVYVDGEATPSTFGTGTEDYFGYAWGSTHLFQRPFHGQTRCDGPLNYGHSTLYRFQTFDPIPFRQSLNFDMERLHWQNVDAVYDRTVYWYAAPGTTPPTGVSERDLAFRELLGPISLPGVIEGERLPVLRKGGGTLTAQSFWDLSGGKQLWWIRPASGDRLELELNVRKAGRYRVEMKLCHAPDYGIHHIVIGRQVLDTVDFYAQNLAWEIHDFGVINLRAGRNVLTIHCAGHHPKAEPGSMFGLDYIRLTLP